MNIVTTIVDIKNSPLN